MKREAMKQEHYGSVGISSRPVEDAHSIRIDFVDKRNRH
jgi:hypothetical protein